MHIVTASHEMQRPDRNMLSNLGAIKICIMLTVSNMFIHLIHKAKIMIR
jgi:hypothetical protein